MVWGWWLRARKVGGGPESAGPLNGENPVWNRKWKGLVTAAGGWSDGTRFH